MTDAPKLPQILSSRRLRACLLLGWMLPVLFAVAWVTPPWQNSDEPLHFARAVQIAHGGLIGYRAWGTAGGLSDGAIYDSYRPVRAAAMHPEIALRPGDIAAANAVPWRDALAYTSFPNTAQYPPQFYVPDAAAYWAGRALHLPVARTLLLARLANASIFAAVAAWALTIARRTGFVLAAILTLPMTLSLACSAAQDSLMLAATLLSVAILDRIVAAQREATAAELWGVTALLASVAMARPPYAGFLPALLLAAPRGSRRTLRALAVATAAVAGWCLLTAIHTSVHLGGSDIGLQLALLRAHPASVGPLVVATLGTFLVDYWVEFIGKLGWTDTDLPRAYTFFASAVLLATALASTGSPARRRPAILAGAAFAVVAIFTLQYLTWTWPGQGVITGVLGRYFLPVAMVLALALPASAGPGVLRKRVAVAALVAAALVTPPLLLHVLNARYYLEAK